MLIGVSFHAAVFRRPLLEIFQCGHMLRAQEQGRMLQLQPVQQHLSIQLLTVNGEELVKEITEQRSRHVLPPEDRPMGVGTVHCVVHQPQPAPCRPGVLVSAGRRNLRRTSCAARLIPGNVAGHGVGPYS
jgi:hypothetical protein